MELDALYVEALRRVARWADDTLETEVAETRCWLPSDSSLDALASA